MSDEVRDYDEELEGICEEIRKGIDQISSPKSKLKPQERADKINYLNGRVNRAKQVFKSLKVELRDLPKSEAEPYQKKVKQYNDDINKFIQDLTWISDKEALVEGSTTTTTPQQMDAMTTAQLLEKGQKVQEKSLDSLGHTLQTIDSTKEVGSATAQKLHEQTEQLVKVGEQVDEMQSYLDQANKELRSFVRRIATDKIILGLICIIVVGIIVIIVMSALNV